MNTTCVDIDVASKGIGMIDRSIEGWWVHTAGGYIENYGDPCRELDNLIMREEKWRSSGMDIPDWEKWTAGGWFRSGRGESAREKNDFYPSNLKTRQMRLDCFSSNFSECEASFCTSIWKCGFFFFFWTNKLLTLGWNSLTNPYTVRSQQSYAIQSLLIINSKLLGENGA